jgi:hypothetical protein
MKRQSRLRGLRVQAFFCALAAASAASADAVDAGASLSCDPSASAGRVVCAVDARVSPDDVIAWGDVIFLATPAFASPLRARVGPQEATRAGPAHWRWAFAVVARSPGSGTIEGRVRLVVCRGALCSPRELRVAGPISVAP